MHCHKPIVLYTICSRVNESCGGRRTETPAWPPQYLDRKIMPGLRNTGWWSSPNEAQAPGSALQPIWLLSHINWNILRHYSWHILKYILCLVAVTRENHLAPGWGMFERNLLKVRGGLGWMECSQGPRASSRQTGESVHFFLLLNFFHIILFFLHFV